MGLAEGNTLGFQTDQKGDIGECGLEAVKGTQILIDVVMNTDYADNRRVTLEANEDTT